MTTDGAYGSPGIDIDGGRYKSFLLVSGGIGITPMQAKTRGRFLQHCLLERLWTVFFAHTPLALSLCSQAICNDLRRQHARGRPLTKLRFVWVVRDREMVDAMGNNDPKAASLEILKLPGDSLPRHFTPNLLTGS